MVENAGRKVNMIVKVRTDEALNQYLNAKHRTQSANEIENAFKVYDELAKQY